MIKLTKCLLITFLFLQSFIHQVVSAENMPIHLVDWAHANPVISIGVDGTFPPFDYIDEQDVTQGAGKLIRQQLSSILPVDLQETSVSDFRAEYDAMLLGNIDAISVCGNIEQRQGEVLFTKPFLQMTPILVVNKNSQIKNEIDIKSSQKIAYIAGYADATFAKQLSINPIELTSNLEGYQSIESEQYDGFITYLYLYKYMMKKHNLKNIIPIPISQFQSLPIGFCVNKNKPELVELLNWGIDQLGDDFILAMQSTWAEYSLDEEQNPLTQINKDISLISVSIYALAFVLLVLFFARKFASTIAIKLDTLAFRGTYFTVLFLIILLSVVGIYLFLNDYKKQVLIDQKETFNITRDVTEKTLQGWYRERELLANNIAKSKVFEELVNNLVVFQNAGDRIKTLKAKVALREYFDKRPYTTQEGRAYTISDLQGRYILNLVESGEGKLSTIMSQRPELFNKVLKGRTQFIPPVWSNVNIDNNTDNKDAEIFIASPVRNEQQEIIAVLAFRFDPERVFSRLFLDGRLGNSFESYAVDANGYIISSSRFTQELQQQGIVPVGESSVLHVRLKNPEYNPIVQAAKFKLSGQNLEGYQNYQGKSVVGQWVTIKDANFTIVSEIHLSEMLAEYYDVRSLLLIGLIISSAFILSLSIFMITISNRANEISRRSQSELAEQVKSRTKQLSDSELRSKLINSSVADGILGVDKRGGFIFVNDSACKLLGYSESEILESDIMSLFSETNTELKVFEDTLVYKVMGSEEVVRVANETLILSNGNHFSAEYSISPVNNDESELAAVITFQDITERIQETERVEKMLENLPACMVIMNQEDKVENINQTGIELLGFERDEIVGHSVDLFIPAEQVESHKALLKKFFAEEIVIDTQALERNFRVKHKSGKLIDIQAVYTPVRFYDGLYAVVMVRDITIEKEAEFALIEAKRISDDASKAKSDFLANMSHEIRTPMNAIMGMSHLALGCDLERKPQNYVTKVYKAAESLLGIINDILDFSKIEAGKLDIEVIEFNLHDAFADLANIISLKAAEKSLELLFDISPDVPLILKGDPLRLNQILINLAGNAVKFTEKGQIVISVGMTKHDSIDADNIILEFSVKDSGIGMSDEQQGKLFKSFSQADSSITRKYGGTGLGLTISKKLVELMQGNIWLESIEGQGSCFSFTAHLKTSANNNRGVIEQQKSFLEGKRILIVDDNELALEVLSSILISFNCHVVPASSGQQAMELANQATIAFDFIMLDWKMPELDGIETYQMIKSQNNYQDNQFILVTSNANDVETVEQLKSSINSVLVKPVTSSSIFDELMHLSGEEAFTITREMKRDDTLLENQRSLQGAKILLVEDNELNQELAIELLKESGIDVDLAENGAIAVERVASNIYDGILMDLQMPIMDGFSATKVIRNTHPQLPIIAMTANAMVSDKEKVLAAGMNDHITKPINVNNMFATIARWVTPSHSEKAVDSEQVKQAQNGEHTSSEKAVELVIADFISIDKEAGLMVANGNKSLYVKLLGRFITGQEDFVERFKASMAKEDQEESTRFAHTLKGSAGNIGAKLLQQSADNLESACVQNYNFKALEPLLTHTEAELNKVVVELIAYLVKFETRNDNKGTVDFVFTEQIKIQLAELLTLVEDFETEALELAQDIIDQLKGSKDEVIFQRIYQKIEGYEFSEAEESLITFINNINK
jgi:polar amino acid transport system substrate-binding protein